MLLWLAVMCLLLLAPASAGAAQRWTTPDSTATSGSCTPAAPCQIDHAVAGAAAGDEVIVTPGTYDLASSLVSPAAIDLHGVAGQPRPRLIGHGGTALLEFKSAGSLRHLALEATGSAQDALTLRGGVAEDLLLLSVSGDGAKVNGVPDGTVLRDSLVQTTSVGVGSAGIKLRDSGAGGDAKLVNVTIIATTPTAKGIRCELSNGQARLINTIVRGVLADVDASSGNCTARSSNFRPLLSPGVVSETGNQSAEPRFVDAARGDFRPLADSPTVDAGTNDALLGASDPAGCLRTLGAAPDIGAYELADPAVDPCAWAPPEPALSDPTLPSTGDIHLDIAIRELPPPVGGKTVIVNPGKGRVRIRRPASTVFEPLDEAAAVPVGSIVDASAGRVHLVSATSDHGGVQAGQFWGSKFEVRQRGAMTTLILRGGDF
ncbi:MAG TPA: choice-of-anchor Q domain-containing protein, partial [Thermoleophilaceae bacterium]|nr:choice-of-anchor Q domain-containing protein [Thermoleophilaceae bacterium]